MFNKAFGLALLERAIRGGALVASGIWGVSQITDVDALANTGAAAGVGFVWGAVGSVLLSLAASTVGQKGDPSFTKAETINPEGPAL